MNLKKIIGLVCIVLGVYFMANANKSMDSTKEKVRKHVVGGYSHHTRNYMIAGIGLIVVGGALLFFFRGMKK